jgi:ketosteroid isomerase-like protein
LSIHKGFFIAQKTGENSAMTKAKLRAATVGGTADEIEAAFYEALINADLSALMACWADEDDIVCIHPGGIRRVGNAAIRQSFETLFSNGPVTLQIESMHKVESLTSAMHNLIERVFVMTNEGRKEALVHVTNVYQRTAQGWRMVAHHASPGVLAPGQDATASPGQVLH